MLIRKYLTPSRVSQRGNVSGPLRKQIEGLLAEGEGNISVKLLLRQELNSFFGYYLISVFLSGREVLGSRGFNLKTTCELYGMAPETIIHVLRERLEARKPRIPWKLVFPQAIWLIWLEINKFVFQTGRINPSTCSHCIKKGAEFYAIVPNNPSKSNRIQIQVKWSKTQPGWVKINTSGSFFGNPKKAGGETLLNDCKSLMRTFTNCTVAHVYGEANNYAED
uniref:Uncharacterized protein n=1 Tax=Quercus lobata TaxID=97700 RepID=A0A7N2L285_QUELO